MEAAIGIFENLGIVLVNKTLFEIFCQIREFIDRTFSLQESAKMGLFWFQVCWLAIVIFENIMIDLGGKSLLEICQS